MLLKRPTSALIALGLLGVEPVWAQVTEHPTADLAPPSNTGQAGAQTGADAASKPEQPSKDGPRPAPAGQPSAPSEPSTLEGGTGAAEAPVQADGSTGSRAPADANGAAAGSKAGSAAGPLWVVVNAEPYSVDEEAVRVAIARELGVTVTSAQTGAVASVRVSVSDKSDMVVTYRDSEGRELMRAIEAPERADEVPEAVALLVGNLARDQASGLLAQLTPEEAAQPPEPRVEAKPQDESARTKPLAKNGVNLALLHPIALVPDSHERRIHLDMSLAYSRVGELDGAAFGLGVQRIDGRMRGAQFSPVNLHFGPGDGASCALFATVRKGDFRGLTAGALYVGQLGKHVGFIGSGVASTQRGDMQGINAAGVAVASEGDVDGAQLAGVASLSVGDARGLLASGAAGVHHGSLIGLQTAGVATLTTEDVIGAQVATANVAGGGVDGAQIGIVNVAWGEVRGAQIGLFNFARDVKGASIGAITYSKEGKTQLVSWFDTTQPVNIGVRFYTGPLYAMPTFGIVQESGQQVLAPGLTLGGRVEIGPVFVDLDANYANRIADGRFDEHHIDLRYRGMLGVQPLDWLGVFAGSGVLHQLQTSGPFEESFEPIFVAGVQFF